jgi:hypothetical protein
VTWPDGTRGIFPHIIERGKPGVIAVRADGRRFVNEANGYHDYVRALLAATPDGEVARSWMICDHAFIRRWGLGIVRPGPLPMGYWLKSGYLHRAPTLEALAGKLGIAPQVAQTVVEYNNGAREGRDEQFGRGWSPYNRYQGDPERAPNPNVAPIEHGPFYAIEVIPGSFGSFAGLRTDADARVLRGDGSPIPGLFAAGADMASIMGGHYPAGGINLAPPWCSATAPRWPPRHRRRSALRQPAQQQPNRAPPGHQHDFKGRPRLRRKGSHRQPRHHHRAQRYGGQNL